MGEYITKPVCKVLMLKGEKGSGSTWGDIGGNLNDQKDLMTALNNRADRTAITNISVNGERFTATRSNGTTFDFTSVSTWGDIDGNLNDQKDLMTALNNRADRTAITNISVNGGRFTATRSNGTTFDFTLSAITNSQIDAICK